MKKIVFVLLFFFSMLSASCLGEEKGLILNLGGSNGIDTIKIKDNYAYVSLNYETGDFELKGFARIDVSDISKFIPYDSEKYETIQNYLDDIKNIVTVYQYGKAFVFDENITPDFSITHVITEDENVSVFGYANNYENNVSYLFKITLQNGSIAEVNYKKFENSSINGVFSMGNYDYFIGKIEGYLKLFKSDYNSYTQPVDIQTIPFLNLTKGSIVADENNIYVEIENHVFKINIYTKEIKDITSLFETEIGKLIFASCGYIFYSYDFDKLVMMNLETGEKSSVKVWDPAQGEVIGNTLFLANYGGPIYAINISDPENIYVEANTTEWAMNDFIYYYDQKLFVGGGWRGLAVYDASGCDVNESTFCYTTEENITDENITYPSCLSEEYLSSLPEGWSLVGVDCQIDDMNVFNGVNVVWLYRNGKWFAYSNNENIKTLLMLYGFWGIDKIYPNEGFWIKK